MSKKEAEQEWLIRRIAEGDPALDTASINHLSEQLGICLNKDKYFCIVLRYAVEGAMVADASMPMSLYSACVQAAKNYTNDLYCYIGTQFYVVMIVSDDENRTGTVDKLYQTISKHSRMPIQLGVGGSYHDVAKISYSRVEAYEALNALGSDGQISYIDDIYIMRSITTRKLEGEKRKIVELFKAGQLDQMMSNMAQLAEKVRIESPVREGRPYPTSIRRTVVELLFEIMHICADAGVDVDELLNYQDPYTVVFEIQGTPQILAWFRTVVDVLYKRISELSSSTESNMLSLAKKCIDEHLSNPNLSLSLVSDKLGITSTYFSAFFIREVGIGFNEYMTGLRVERAKSLLSNTNKKVSDIAAECGFRSASYFIVVFRKQMGMSPGEYRNKKM